MSRPGFQMRQLEKQEVRFSSSRAAAGVWGGAACRRWLAPVVGLTTISQGYAQQALRTSLAGEAAAAAVRVMAVSVKAGDFRLQVTPSLALDWNDNINLSATDILSDAILRPTITVGATYPLGKRNLLNLDVSVGYSKYVQHDELSQWSVTSQSGSGWSFDIYINNCSINIHDRFRTSQDAAQESAVAGTGTYGIFENTAGLSSTWDLRDVTLTLGYDHENTLSLFDASSNNSGGQGNLNNNANSMDNTSELFMARVGLAVHPRLSTGVEGTATFSKREQSELNDYNSYSLGIFGDWRPGAYFNVQPRLGYMILDASQTSVSVKAGNANSWYGSLTLAHQPNTVLSYSLTAGHEIRAGIQSDAIESYYVRPSMDWALIRHVTLHTSLFYEHGTLAGGQPTSLQEKGYDWYGGGLNLAYSPMKRVVIALNYRLTLRDSNEASREYAQNMVGLQITYTPQ